MSKPPDQPSFDLRDELNRKASDTLAQILQDHGCGVSSHVEARASIAALFSAISGLVDKEVFELISEASAEINKDTAAHAYRRLFTNGSRLVSLEYQWGEAQITLKIATHGNLNWESCKVISFGDEANPFAAAKDRFDQYVSSFIRQGYEELI